jgi:hypothetical protein
MALKDSKRRTARQQYSIYTSAEFPVEMNFFKLFLARSDLSLVQPNASIVYLDAVSAMPYWRYHA